MKQLLVIITLLATLSAWAAPVRDKHVSADLISENARIAAAQPFWVAVRLIHDEHWHTYWINDGDSGLPTEIDWNLPEGFTAGEIQWPPPQRIPMDPLVSYGYEGEAWLLVQITPPTQLTAESVTLEASVKWLMCKEVCIPGRAKLSVTLPVGPVATVDPAAGPAFATARQRLPTTDTAWTFRTDVGETSITLHASPPAGAPALESWELFGIDKNPLAASLKTEWVKTERGYETVLERELSDEPLPDTLNLVMTSQPTMARDASRTAIEVRIPLSATTVTTAEPGAAGTSSGADTSSLPTVLLLAFAGGMILNLMPCVFPVISLKILSFVNQSRNDPRTVWHHGLVFAAGVVVSFWILAGLLIALRAGGESIGWGFQLQSPPVLIVLCLVFFALALNLFGVFEFGLSLTSAGGELTAKQGWSGSFFSGFLATVIATPCTAPFMGVALGYALTQPPYVSMLVFTALAFGMAFPYLLLSRFPALLQRLPRPGAWMITMKQIMGFCLVATVLWLFWVLAALVTAQSLIIVLAGLLLVAVAAWVFGKWDTFERRAPVRLISRIIALTLAILGVAAPLSAIERTGNESVEASGLWEPFTPERLAELRAEGRPVFIDFTAKWCLTCQVNKLTVLRKDDMTEAFRAKNVALLVADWTDENEMIAAELAKHGRQSVPLYVLYPANPGGGPVILPELLTRKIVLDALQDLN